jgi:hypothetical protein
MEWYRDREVPSVDSACNNRWGREPSVDLSANQKSRDLSANQKSRTTCILARGCVGVYMCVVYMFSSFGAVNRDDVMQCITGQVMHRWLSW